VAALGFWLFVGRGPRLLAPLGRGRLPVFLCLRLGKTGKWSSALCASWVNPKPPIGVSFVTIQDVKSSILPKLPTKQSQIKSRSIAKSAELPEVFGFRNGQHGPHASRTMMLAELRDLLAAVSADGEKTAYRDAIMEDNVLGKRTLATRRESYERLGWLYALSPDVTLFRTLRHFWDMDKAARPLLALLCASARDPLLRMTAKVVLGTPVGETLSNERMEEALALGAPGRFKQTILVKIARNAGGSWTHAGYLQGHRQKTRVRPLVTPGAVAYALLLSYLAGASGQMLLSAFWTRLLDCPQHQLPALAADASARGWIAYRQSGQVVEVRFPELLTPEEMEIRREQD